MTRQGHPQNKKAFADVLARLEELQRRYLVPGFTGVVALAVNVVDGVIQETSLHGEESE